MKLRILGALAALLLPTFAFAETEGGYLVRYFSNVTVSNDTVVNMTDTGSTNGIAVPINVPAATITVPISGGAPITVTLQPETFNFTSNGNICANVYVIDPFEEEINCCYCFLTPDGLYSFSTFNELLYNSTQNPFAFPSAPASGVIKIVASLPVTITPSVLGTSTISAGTSTSCNPGSVGTTQVVPRQGGGWTLGQPPLATGLLAWARGNGAETGFANGDLNTNELNHLVQLCNFNQTNGTGPGVCKNCNTGGL